MIIGLKPCPFCGSQAKLRVRLNDGVTVQCSKCYVQTRSRVDLEHGTDAVRTVVEDWNRRAGAVVGVKCKDCRHFQGNDRECLMGLCVCEDDFCSWGVEKASDS